MATRFSKEHDQKTRLKIQTSQILNRLQNHVLTHPEEEDFKKKFMHPSQVNAALGLLKKTLPDITQIEGSIKHDHDHKHVVKQATNDFLDQYTPKLNTPEHDKLN